MSSSRSLRRATVRRQPLVVQSGIVPPLNSVTLFAMLALAAWGSYLLGQSFANPMASDITPVIVGAVMVSTAGVLFFCLAKRRPIYWSPPLLPAPQPAEVQLSKKPPAIVLPTAKHKAWSLSSAALAFHRVYVDHVWIRR
jgi:hypothetical protein